jgi:hypothetical protein
VTTAEAMIVPLGRALDALEASDVDGFMAIIEQITHPECEWVPYISGQVEGRTFRGLDGMRAWASDLLEAFEVHYADRQLRAFDDNTVIFLSRFVYRGRGSGAETSHEVGVLWIFEDGLFRRGTSYGSHGETLAGAEALAQ